MVISEMSKEDCLRVLAAAKLARLACAHEDQPYIVPVYLAYYEPSRGDACLYGFTTLGQKITWMRANPLVCVEVDEVTAYDQWVSVITLGRYEELPETPMNDIARGRLPEQSDDRHVEAGSDNEAWQVLKSHPMWQEPGSTAWKARAHINLAERLIPIFFRIQITSVTGHRATTDTNHAIPNSVAALLPPNDAIGRVEKSAAMEAIP